MQFLITLTDDLEFVCASLLHRTFFPALETIIAELLSEEIRLATLKVRHLAMSIDTVLTTSTSSQTLISYHYCYRPNHLIANC